MNDIYTGTDPITGMHIRVVNLYGYRATKPGDLWAAADPVGPENDHALRVAFLRAYNTRSQVIAAWGTNARPERVDQVRDLAAKFAGPSGCGRGINLTALHVTKGGAPGHPLYIPSTARPVEWPAAGMGGVR